MKSYLIFYDYILSTVGGFTRKVKIAPIIASTAAIINVGFKPPAFATIIGPTNAAAPYA
ncbi:hypothetical protein [Anaeromicrobium sediminis]|uniref:hypothetical protein n=1 Tax=Anaeromicrobium sediminis TaxID=1478221 RepID=UPI0015960D7E|nr:hypothetical protein [Anaeromicrobium sediminis]